MLEIKNLSIDINGRYLIKNLNITLKEGDKLAIIGEEGNGKSSILKALMGECSYANVTIDLKPKNVKLSYCAQVFEDTELELKVFDYLFEDVDVFYESTNLFYKLTNEVMFNLDLLDQTLKNLSGGEKVKVRILKIMMQEADVLLLDEPTNDLDIKTLKWLENFINKTSIPIIYVSHDETLLSNTANSILHLEQINDKTESRYTYFKTGYDEYIEMRSRKIDNQIRIANSERRNYDKAQTKLRDIMNKVEREQNNISRSDPHGAKLLKKKMHSLKSQERRLDNQELTEIPEVEEAVNFFFKDTCLPNGKIILMLDIPVLKVNDKILCRNIKLDILANEHMCIIGQNGVGKSTLIKIIYKSILGKDGFHIGYMPQNYNEVLKGYTYVLDFLTDKNKDNITKARTLLSSLKFTVNETIGKIEDLSNGSKAKLILASLVLKECNILILDEPTRNTSPLTNPVIRKVLKNFKGTTISVSHDRKYLNEVVDKCYNLTSNGVEEVTDVERT